MAAASRERCGPIVVASIRQSSPGRTSGSTVATAGGSPGTRARLPTARPQPPCRDAGGDDDSRLLVGSIVPVFERYTDVGYHVAISEADRHERLAYARISAGSSRRASKGASPPCRP